MYLIIIILNRFFCNRPRTSQCIAVIQNVLKDKDVIRVSFTKLLAVSSCSSRRIISAPEPRRQLDRSPQLTAVSAQPPNQEEEPRVQRAGKRVRRRLGLRRDGIRLWAGRWRGLGVCVATVPTQTVRWNLLHRLAAWPGVDVHPAPSSYISVIRPVHQHRDCQLGLGGLVCAVRMSSQTASQLAEEERTDRDTPAPSSPAVLQPTSSHEPSSLSTPLRGTGCEL